MRCLPVALGRPARRSARRRLLRQPRQPGALPDQPVKLADLCGELAALALPARSDADHPDRPVVLAAREACTRAIADDDFVVDCIAHELELISTGVPRSGL